MFMQSDIPASAISIHALREEGDGSKEQTMANVIVFLSTPSARRATSARSRRRP